MMVIVIDDCARLIFTSGQSLFSCLSSAGHTHARGDCDIKPRSNGDPGVTRTRNVLLRRQVLYPVELRGRGGCCQSCIHRPVQLELVDE